MRAVESHGFKLGRGFETQRISLLDAFGPGGIKLYKRFETLGISLLEASGPCGIKLHTGFEMLRISVLKAFGPHGIKLLKAFRPDSIMLLKTFSPLLVKLADNALTHGNLNSVSLLNVGSTSAVARRKKCCVGGKYEGWLLLGCSREESGRN